MKDVTSINTMQKEDKKKATPMKTPVKKPEETKKPGRKANLEK